MYKLLSSILLLFISEAIIAQQKKVSSFWHLTIVDNNTNQGIEKATIRLSKKWIYVSDNTGATAIDKSVINVKDSVIISFVDYQSKHILIQGNKYPDTVKLSVLAIALKEVKINPHSKIPIILGDEKKVYKVHRRTSLDGAYAEFIPNVNKISGTITSVTYVVNDITHGIALPFRVRLYTKLKDSLTLDKELTTDSIIVYNAEKKTKIVVDISKYHIQLPAEGVIAIFETLPRHYYTSVLLSDSSPDYGVETPGIDMDITKNNCEADNNKIDRSTPYAMVGPSADRWNRNGVMNQWYAYKDGNNFAITITVDRQQ